MSMQGCFRNYDKGNWTTYLWPDIDKVAHDQLARVFLYADSVVDDFGNIVVVGVWK